MKFQPIPRRDFLKTSVSLAASAITAPSMSFADTKNKIQFIDIHTHLGAFYPDRDFTAEMLIRFMDERHVEKSCVLPLISPEAAPIPQPVATAIDAFKKYPDRIIPFCVIDPRVLTAPPLRTGHIAGVKGLIEMLKRYQDAGCKGLGEHKTGMLFNSKQNMYLYEACTSVGLPILFHLDDIRNIDTPGLPRLEDVLKKFPTLPLIGHAAGFWASISADATREDFGRYPKLPTPVKAGGALDVLMSKYKNLYGDLSEPGGYRAIARDPKFGREFIIRNTDQLLFGTDVLMPNQNIPQFKLFESLNLPEQVQYKVYRGNAIKLLKLKTS